MSALDPGADFGSVLVVCTQQIGDVLLTTPLISAVRQRWPQASIDVLGFAGTLGMLDGNVEVRNAIEVPRGQGWRKSMPLIRRLWRAYDLALITQRGDRAHLYGWLAAPTRAGAVPYGASASSWKRRLLAHAVPIDSAAQHMVVDKLRLLEPWRPDEALAQHPIIVTPPRSSPLPASWSDRLEPRYVVVHAPSMWRYKQWPLEHFRALVRGLLRDGCQVVLTGGPGDADRRVVKALAEPFDASRVLDAAGQLGWGQMRTLLERASLYVGPDTSITHLAAACSVPTVALFGPTDPQTWGPWPQGHAAGAFWQSRAACQRGGTISLMQGPNSCVPCGQAGCDRHNGSRADCLEALMPERVLEEARMRLAEKPRRARAS